MSNLPAISDLILASHNRGKIEELRQLLTPIDVRVISAAEKNLPDIEETGQSFAANALLKAEAAARQTGLPALGDDSGFEVEALNGRPGIFSARYAGEARDFATACRRLQGELAEKNCTTSPARFVCALALAWPSPKGEKIVSRVFEGKIEGQTCFPPRGDKGFGYDPIFVPQGYALSFGEMPPTQKNAISHRALAFGKFLHALQASPHAAPA